MEMIKGIHPRFTTAAFRSGRVQRTRCGTDGASLEREGGFTLIEVVMTMVLLSIGLMSLVPLMLSVVQGNRFAQDLTLATSLAEDRIEEILHYPDYSQIITANFPNEAQGQIRQGDPRYAKFARSVTIADSLDIIGRCVLKSVTVTVTWTGLNQRTRDVTIHGRVARF